MPRKSHIILVDVVPPITTKDQAVVHLQEIMSLIGTYEEGKIVKIIQRRAHPHPATYMGTGKSEEVAQLIQELEVDIVIVNGFVTSAQLFRLTKLFWPVNPHIQVWDRVDLILAIFSKHAHTAEAKLQISLAHMKHMGPRMYGLSEELGRQGGGIGGRGIGETNVELMKRHWRDAIRTTEKKIADLITLRQRQIDSRRQNGLQTVAIIGYTNAGKTTLFNTLTGKHKLAKNVLFATLDSTVGKVYLPDTHKTVLVSDTIGFIRDLPPELIDAFKSTLLASLYADLLIHVVDASDPEVLQKIRTVDGILRDLHIDHKPQLLIFNKIDLLEDNKYSSITHLIIDRPCVSVNALHKDMSAITSWIANQLHFS